MSNIAYKLDVAVLDSLRPRSFATLTYANEKSSLPGDFMV